MPQRTDRPTVAGVYRMTCESGNSYFTVYEPDQGPKNRGGNFHVFQPRRFRCESFSCDGWDDTVRKFGPLFFEQLVIAEPTADGALELAEDMHSRFQLP